MELTPTELAILGLIAEQPRHGYDLDQVIEQRGIRRWAEIGFSSIYYVLTKLEGRGLIESDDAQTGAKSRRVFHATTAGRHAAKESTVTFIADQRTVVHPVLVGLANLSLISEEDYVDSLQRRLIWIDKRISAVTAAERSQSPLPRPAREVFSYSLSLLEAERSWLATRVPVSNE
ncbi:PadR family transcriptional regulator [Rhodococcus sp. H36-A4]|uniref:PadR family transcriptional regulator n=1 Tax=Rhodococcus sp. H36-A4 TaxID=3004353 RepID=UPI0022AFACAB|nr:PadR family transcriptional regulator [Rhodococcus sp. H36-A4]MCZ4077208.1 PadR family transcriptional regulator [Rhodococcus sp. H36-A4]